MNKKGLSLQAQFDLAYRVQKKTDVLRMTRRFSQDVLEDEIHWIDVMRGVPLRCVIHAREGGEFCIPRARAELKKLRSDMGIKLGHISRSEYPYLIWFQLLLCRNALQRQLKNRYNVVLEPSY